MQTILKILKTSRDSSLEVYRDRELVEYLLWKGS